MSRRKLFFTALLAVISVGPSFAQQPDRQSAAYMWNSEMQKRLYALAGKWLDDTFNKPLGIDPGERKYFEELYE